MSMCLCVPRLNSEWVCVLGGVAGGGPGVSSMSIFVLGVCVLGWCVSAHLRELGLTRFPLVSRAVPRAEVTHPPISFSWEPAWESE